MIGRALRRTVALALCGAGGLALWTSTATPAEPRAAIEVAVPTPQSVVACPGEAEVPVGSVGTGGDLSSDPTQRSLDVLPEGVWQASSPVRLETPLAAQSEVILDGDIAGLAAVSCAAAATEQWLVGGATALGSSTRLVLSNPAQAPTEVTVSVYGPLGPVSERLVVPVAALSREDVLIEGLAPQLSAIAVRVVASGPGVVAVLQDSRLSGFQPAGTDWVAASDLGSQLVIPGIDFGFEAVTSTLRLLAPDGATVELTLHSEDGVESWPAGSEVVLEPGVVTDLEVPAFDLAAITILADAPVVAAARVAVPRAAGADFDGDLAFDHAWVPAMRAMSQATAIVTVEQPATLVVFSEQGGVVEFTDADGAPLSKVTVAAGTVQRVEVDVPVGTVLTTDAQTLWAQLIVSESMLSVTRPLGIVGTQLEASVSFVPYGG